jgi:hypothetical protein
MIIRDIPFLFRFQIEGHPDAEAGWSFPSLNEARSMAHYTLRQALLGQQEPCGYAQIFDGISGDPLGAVAAILHENSEHWTWQEAEKDQQRAH